MSSPITADIVAAEFAKVRHIVDDGRGTGKPLDGLDLDTLKGAEVWFRHKHLTDIERLIKTTPLFFKSGAFDWAADPDAYNDPLELAMQRDLMVVLSEISEDHPDLQRLPPVAVKWVTNPYFSSVCLRGETVSFICISNGFARFLQAVVGTVIRLHDVGVHLRWLNSSLSNYLFGADVERALKRGGETVDQAITFLIDAAVRLMDGQSTGLPYALTPRLVGDIKVTSPMLAHAYSSSELFIVMHELTHLLRGHNHRRGRTLADELAADRGAQSLLVIAGSQLDYDGTFYVGPIMFLQVARLYDEICRMTRLARHPYEGELDDERELESGIELKLRLEAVVKNAEKMVPGPRGLGMALLEETAVLIAAVQAVHLTAAGLPTHFEDQMPRILASRRSEQHG